VGLSGPPLPGRPLIVSLHWCAKIRGMPKTKRQVAREVNEILARPLPRYAQGCSLGSTTGYSKRGPDPTLIEGLDSAYDFSPGTHLQGHLEATYADLVRLLGSPNAPVDDYKTTTAWSLQYEGAPISIYDYKATSAYGSGRPSPEKFRALSRKHSWHVGSDGSETAARGIQRIKDSIARVRPQRKAQARVRRRGPR
jgi:hypothetical protein